jgi:hypothetical protein
MVSVDQQLPNPGGPWDPSEIAWGLRRPAAYHTPIPRVGERVLVRVQAFAPLADAQVLGVEPWDSYDDHYLWHVVTDAAGQPERDGLGNRLLRPAPDPWPWLLLASPWGRFTIREGRVRGGPGWWPLDWERRWYPVPGGGRLAHPIDERMPT